MSHIALNPEHPLSLSSMTISAERVGAWYRADGSEALQYAMSADDLVTDPAELRAAIDAGMRITVTSGSSPASVTSLDFLEPVIDDVQDLWVGTVGRVVGANILPNARLLRSLAFAAGACSDRPDLSSLPHLEEFSGGVTRTTASVLRNPDLRFLRVEGVIPKSFARVAGKLEVFEHHGARSATELPVFEHPESMRRMLRVGPSSFNLRQLEGMTNLAEFRLNVCGEVIGLASLARLPHLSRLQFNGVATREDWADVPVVGSGFMLDITPYPSESVLASWAAAGWILPDRPASPVDAITLDEAGDGEAWGVFIAQFDGLAEAAEAFDGTVAGGLHGELFILGIVAELRSRGVTLDPEPDSENGFTAVYFPDRAQAEQVFLSARVAINAGTTTKIGHLRAGARSSSENS